MTITPLKHKPLADIENADQNTRTFDNVEPVYLRKLAQRMNTTELAKALGYTPTGITAIVNGDTGCRTVVELAAELVYEQKFGNKKRDDKNVCAFVTGSLAMLKTVQAMIGVGGGNFTFIELPTE